MCVRHASRMPVGVHAQWAAPCAAAAVALGLIVHRRVRAWMPVAGTGDGLDGIPASTTIAGLALLPVLLCWQLANAQGYALSAVTVSLALVGHFDDRRSARGGKATYRSWFAVAVATAALAAQHAGCDASFAFACAWLLAVALVQATRALESGVGLCAAVSAGTMLGNEWMFGMDDHSHAHAGWAALGFLPWSWPRSRVALGACGSRAFGVCVADAALGNLPLSTLASSANAVQFERAWDHRLLAALLLLPFSLQFVEFAHDLVMRISRRASSLHADSSCVARVARAVGVPALLVAPVLGMVAFAVAPCVAWWTGIGFRQ
jgi:hypothetical protein